MTPMSNAVLFLVNIVFSLYIFVLLLRILLEAVKIDYYNPLFQFVARLTDWPLKPFQLFLPRVKILDFPAIFLLLIVEGVKLILFSLIVSNFPSIAGLIVWTVADAFKELINLYFYMILLFVLLGWVGGPRAGMVAITLFKMLDPLLRHARRIIPHIGGMDFSPLLVIIILQLVNILLLMPIIQFAMNWSFGS